MKKYIQNVGNGMLPLRGKGDLVVSQGYARKSARPSEYEWPNEPVLIEVDKASFSSLAYVSTYDDMVEMESLGLERKYFKTTPAFIRSIGIG